MLQIKTAYQYLHSYLLTQVPDLATIQLWYNQPDFADATSGAFPFPALFIEFDGTPDDAGIASQALETNIRIHLVSDLPYATTIDSSLALSEALLDLQAQLYANLHDHASSEVGRLRFTGFSRREPRYYTPATKLLVLTSQYTTTLLLETGTDTLYPEHQFELDNIIPSRTPASPPPGPNTWDGNFLI